MRSIATALIPALLALGFGFLVKDAQATHTFTCSDNLYAQWVPLPLTEITFTGNSSCTAPVAEMHGQATLYEQGTNNLEAEGNPFACTLCMFGESTGTYLTVAGTSHRAIYIVVKTAPPGHVWIDADPRCSGTGTPTITCTLTLDFTVRLGEQMQLAPGGVTLTGAPIG